MMYDLDNIRLYIDHELSKFTNKNYVNEDMGYITSYRFELTFRHNGLNGDLVGVLDVSFDVFGFGIEGYMDGIDIQYEVGFFKYDEDEYLNDVKAMVLIFQNFSEEVTIAVDEARYVLIKHYVDGEPLASIFDDIDGHVFTITEFMEIGMKENRMCSIEKRIRE